MKDSSFNVLTRVVAIWLIAGILQVNPLRSLTLVRIAIHSSIRFGASPFIIFQTYIMK